MWIAIIWLSHCIGLAEDRILLYIIDDEFEFCNFFTYFRPLF